MQVIYKKTIVDLINEAQQKSASTNKEIDCIALTRDELLQLKKELPSGRFPLLRGQRQHPLDLYLGKWNASTLLNFEFHGVRIVAAAQQAEEF
jgi:hypothetical protein